MENVKKDSALVRSSAAEYLTFVASTGEDKDSIEMRYEDENIWLTQKMMATLYDVGLPTINEHIKKIYADHEQDETATIRKFRIVQNEGGRQVTRSVNHYNLQMIIAVGFKVNNQRAVRFRVWANQIVEQYTIKGWAMDEERLKNGGTVLTKKYFEEQLERIREIRISERNFYQKLTDIYATSLDYDRNALTTKAVIAVPPIEEQKRIVSILDRFDAICNDLTSGLPAEMEARQKQYEYYRDKLLTFKEVAAT